MRAKKRIQGTRGNWRYEVVFPDGRAYDGGGFKTRHEAEVDAQLAEDFWWETHGDKKTGPAYWAYEDGYETKVQRFAFRGGWSWEVTYDGKPFKSGWAETLKEAFADADRSRP